MIHQSALRYFLSVANSGSIRKASDELRVAQSAVSRQILRLEAELEVPLFKRRTNGVQLTAAGEMFLRYVRHSSGQVGRLKSEIRELEDRQLRHVRATTVNSLTYHVMPLAIARFREANPGITFEVFIGSEQEMIDTVLGGEADFGVCYEALRRENADVLFRHEAHLTAMVRRSHPLARLDRVSLRQLSKARLALPNVWSETRHQVDKGASRAGLKLKAAVETSAVQIRLNLALQDDIVAILLSGTFPPGGEYADLVPLRLDPDTFDPMPIIAFKAQGQKLPKAAAAFVPALRATIEEQDRISRSALIGSRPSAGEKRVRMVAATAREAAARRSGRTSRLLR